MNPEDLNLYKNTISTDAFFHLITQGSKSPNGYMREAALKELGASQHPEAIPYILERLGDWVYVVRETAKQCIRSFLKQDFFEAIVLHMPLIDSLPRKKRADLSAVHKEIIQFITSYELTPLLYNKLSKLPDKSRVMYAHYYLCKGKFTIENLRLLASDKSSLVRLKVLKSLSALEKARQQELLTLFIQDVTAEVRSKALLLAKDFRPALDGYIRNLIADESATVRLFARYELRDDAISFPDLYRQQIKDNYQRAGSILGLAEVGTKEDIPLIESFICDTQPTIQYVSLHALYILQASKARMYALQLLTHPSKKIRFKSIYILTGYVDEEVLAQLKILFRSGNTGQKKTILHLCKLQGGWEVLEELLLATQDPDSSVQDMAWRSLRSWQSKATRFYCRLDVLKQKQLLVVFEAADLKKMNVSNHRKETWKELRFFVKNATN